MNDTDASDSKRPQWYSSGFLPDGQPPASGMSSGSGMASVDGTPGEAMSWDDVDIKDAPAAADGGNLQQRIGEFESAFGSHRGKGKKESSGAVANIGKTALMRAAEAGDAESVQRLIDAGANVNATDMSGRTALMWAALGGHAGAVRLLLYAGADAYASHKNGVTAFMLAQARGHKEVVGILHAVTGEGDDATPPAAPHASTIFSSRRRAVQFAIGSALLCIAAGALFYSLGRLASTSAPAPAPARPSAQGSVDAVLRGVDINARDAAGQTPLMRAAASGDAERVRRLIAVGAKLNDVDKQGNTALALAQKAAHRDIVDMLRKAGARRPPAKPATKPAAKPAPKPAAAPQQPKQQQPKQQQPKQQQKPQKPQQQQKRQ